MGKLRVLSGHAVCEIPASHGYREVRRHGSHIMMQRFGDAGATTAPVPDDREIRVGTLLSIIRQSGVPQVAFEE